MIEWETCEQQAHTIMATLDNGEQVLINWWWSRDQYQDLIFRNVKYPFTSMNDARRAAELLNLGLGKVEPPPGPLEKAVAILEGDGSGYQDDAAALTHALMYVISYLKEKDE